MPGRSRGLDTGGSGVALPWRPVRCDLLVRQRTRPYGCLWEHDNHVDGRAHPGAGGRGGHLRCGNRFWSCSR